MPPPGVIIDGLTAIANNNRPLAYAWHAFFFVLIIAFVAGWRPTHRTAARLLVGPLASVGLLAWRAGNPFNAAVFGVVFFALSAFSFNPPHARVQVARTWIVASSTPFIVFGWVYPHFVRVDSRLTYTYAAPLGLVPCPTLAMLLGMCAVVRMFRSRAWSATLGLTGLVYGAIGVFRLGVTLDYGLLAAAAFGLMANRSSRNQPAMS